MPRSADGLFGCLSEGGFHPSSHFDKCGDDEAASSRCRPNEFSNIDVKTVCIFPLVLALLGLAGL